VRSCSAFLKKFDPTGAHRPATLSKIICTHHRIYHFNQINTRAEMAVKAKEIEFSVRVENNPTFFPAGGL
jgi:hypothetical protein